MSIILTPDWERLLTEKARQTGTTPESLVLAALQQQYGSNATHPIPDTDWEGRLRSIGRDCNVSFSHEDVSSEGLYD